MCHLPRNTKRGFLLNREVPIVDFSHFGELYYLTDYIQVANPQLTMVAHEIWTVCSNPESPKSLIDQTTAWVAKSLEYPLDYKGRPTAAQLCKVFQLCDEVYLKQTPKALQTYSWRFPNQTISLKASICFDSACLCTSLLRILGVEAYTVIGVVLRKHQKKQWKILGIHAWTEAVDGRGQQWVIETTVHPFPPRAETPPKDLYVFNRLSRLEKLGCCPL